MNNKDVVIDTVEGLAQYIEALTYDSYNVTLMAFMVPLTRVSPRILKQLVAEWRLTTENEAMGIQ